MATLNAPADKSPAEIAASINDILYRKGVWRGEIRNIKKDGATFWCSALVSAFTHSRYGEVWMSVYKDISERKPAEEALRSASLYMRSLIEASLDPLVTISPTGKIMDVNI